MFLSLFALHLKFRSTEFGNTQLIAEAIGKTLGAAGSVQVKSADQFEIADLHTADLVVMGCPTHKMNLPEAVRPVLAALPKHILQDKAVAVFDTSYKMSWWLNFFTASKRLSRKLQRLGGRRLVPPEIFLVEGREGPLYEGEVERAREWAKTIVAQYKRKGGKRPDRRIRPGLLPTIMALLATAAIVSLGLMRRPAYSRHFEEAEYGADNPFLEPTSVEDGLAVYRVGTGSPLLLFPYPHSQTSTPMAQGLLANLLVDMGRTVVTFDVPGTYRSTRNPAGDMAEMVCSAEETLDRLDITGPVDVVGHSMGSLCALAFAIERPERTRRLVLVGSMSGFPAALRWGMPGSTWRVLDLDYWRFILLGIRVKSRWGTLAHHKQLQNLMGRASYYDRSQFVPVAIDTDDYTKGVPVREILWGKNMARRLSYADRLGSVQAPTLLLVGRHDPQTPLPASAELQAGIPNSRLVIFERSGHSPFVEEPLFFANTVDDFLLRVMNDDWTDSTASP